MSRLRRFSALAIALTCAVLAACDKPNKMPTGSRDPHADIIFTGGEVVTVAEGFKLAKGLAIKDGKVIVVGTSEEVLAYRGPSTKVIDITGKTLIPGLRTRACIPALSAGTSRIPRISPSRAAPTTS